MELMKNYDRARSSDTAVILLLGGGGSNMLTKRVAKWFMKKGVSALCIGPEDGLGYHSFPLECVEEAIRFLKAQGNHRIGILGASITTIPALISAARFPEITLTIAVTPCDFVLQGFSKKKRDGCAEWPVEGESMLTWRGEPLPYVPYAYQHPKYWQMVQEETKGSGNLLSSQRLFRDTEDNTELTDTVMIPVENIRGRLMLIGCKDDTLWSTAHYIRRMDERLKVRAHECRYEALVYEHGTHFAFPESMLRQIIPVFPDFIVSRAFRAAREYPKECKETREDIDCRLNRAIGEWLKEPGSRLSGDRHRS